MYLPTFEALRERGVLERTWEGGELVYRTTPAFRAKAGLYLHQAAAERQAPLNWTCAYSRSPAASSACSLVA